MTPSTCNPLWIISDGQQVLNHLLPRVCRQTQGHSVALAGQSVGIDKKGFQTPPPTQSVNGSVVVKAAPTETKHYQGRSIEIETDV